jgi:hypothetical protein
MLLGTSLDAFVEQSPVSVIVRGTLERVFDPEHLEQVFRDHADLQYTKALTFSHCVRLMSDVVFDKVPSVGAWFQAHRDELRVTRQAVYDKLRHMELPVSAALVGYSAEALLPCLRALERQAEPLLPGYRVRVLDGNHLAGTEHRIFELRRYRAAALAGQALVLYDPQFDVMDAVVPCEDGHAQERSLLGQALALIAERDCLVADRNFCTTGFLFGLHRRGACFVIRQHAATLHWELQGRRRWVGTDAGGRQVYEQAVQLTDPDSAETLVVRRITIALLKPTEQGDMEIHLLTNLPADAADALRVADLYARRWTIEGGFQQLTVDLRCEINTLGYPKAALFGFCVAVVAYNVVAMVKGAIRAVWGGDVVEEQLSMYYLTLEVAQVSAGMLIAVEPGAWDVFGRMSVAEFATTLQELARRMQLHKYEKHKRGPKKKQPKKISGKRHHHVSTAKLIAQRE